MPRSTFTTRYDTFRTMLVEARKDAGLTQVQVAKRLRRPQSFVSKYEGGERRLDVVEFLEVAKALRVDAANFVRRLDRRVPRISKQR